MRQALATAFLLALVAAAPAAAASVDVMVVGRTQLLEDAQPVALKARTVRAGGKRCRVGARTPLSALAGTGVSMRVRDYGACGRSPRDSASLYVSQIGRDRERGRDGWVYKVGRRVGSAGAADPAGPFGRGGLRGGDRVLWFWCVKDRRGDCQRTLEARADKRVAAPGEPIRVTVRGYDERGRGIVVAGATVSAGAASAVTGADGAATLTATARGTLRIVAERDGMVRSFPLEVTVR